MDVTARACACACAYVRVRVRMCMCMCVRVGMCFIPNPDYLYNYILITFSCIPPDRDSVRQIRMAITVGLPLAVELINYKKDGTAFLNQFSLTPVFDEENDEDEVYNIKK